MREPGEILSCSECHFEGYFLFPYSMAASMAHSLIPFPQELVEEANHKVMSLISQSSACGCVHQVPEKKQFIIEMMYGRGRISA